MDAVVAAIRLRPIERSEIDSESVPAVDIDPEKNQVIVSRERSFTLNNVFAANATTDEIYCSVVDRVVDKVTSGYTACVMAYGQTGSGKTYTMGTKVKAPTPGIVQKALGKIFASTGDYEIHVSFLEVYKEEVLDLLAAEKKKMHLVDFKPVGLTLAKTATIESALFEMEKGLMNRHVGATNANLHSSRSHAIFTIHFSKQTEDGYCHSKLYLVDLAGSESVSEMCGDIRKEGVMINKGLLQLGNVMSALSSAEHIPYRNSALTTVLKETLSPQNYVVLLACISPLERDLAMTVNTLQFASRVSSIKGNPEAGLLIKQRMPISTPFKMPITNPFKMPPHFMKGVNTTIATPESYGKIKRPALRPLNKTFDSPRTPRVQQKKPVNWPTSTPFLSGKPLFDPTPIPKKDVCRPVKRRSSSEWDNLDISSSTVLETTSQMKIQSEVNQTGFIQSAENETWLRSLISDVIRQELKSHTFMSQTGVPDGPSPPKQLRRSVRLSKTREEIPSSFQHGDNTAIVSSPNETIRKTGLEMSKSQPREESPSSFQLGDNTAIVSSPNETIRKTGLEMSKSQPVRKSLRLSMRCSHKSKLMLEETIKPVRRSIRLSETSRPWHIVESPCNKSIIEKQQYMNVSKQSKKAARLSERLSILPKATPESAQSRVNNFVLNILQSGNIKKLQSLPTIGPKTATIINNHRIVHGPIGSFKDLSNVRGLSANFLKRFLWANNIILEDDLDDSS
ncbi:Kinesin-like protein KIF27 [Frankliniella fusca]|uniref:Kinesin-like protein n=1 Tax=Frankliniella fusca TaxID=407009 RepID=A0AAE1HPG1_9NEOP|nr:Kinesin-like protein KIF27 [Frankliniella fusca]